MFLEASGILPFPVLTSSSLVCSAHKFVALLQTSVSLSQCLSPVQSCFLTFPSHFSSLSSDLKLGPLIASLGLLSNDFFQWLAPVWLVNRSG